MDFSQAGVYFWFVMDGLSLLWPYAVLGFVIGAFTKLLFGFSHGSN